MFTKKIVYLSLFAGLLAFVSCNNDENVILQQETAATKKIVLQGVEPSEGLFPEDDGSISLAKQDPNVQLYYLLRHADDTLGTSMGTVQISTSEYNTIAKTVETIVKGKTTEKQKYDAIFKWVVDNVKYDYEGANIGQTAYYTFTNHLANCQGYSNLMNVMTHCAGLRSFNVNGYLIYNGAYMGHAWGYVCAGGQWYVCDATNNRQWSASNPTNYKDKLCPQSTDVPIYNDDSFTYSFYNGGFGITNVKVKNQSTLVVPFSKNGIQINVFNPFNVLSTNIKEIYLGKNITTIGDSYSLGLRIFDSKSLEAVHVDPQNETLASHKGIVYRRNGEELQLLYIPTGTDYVELSPKLYSVEKETLSNNTNVNVLYIPEGVQVVEQYAVENCPNLHFIYVPENIKYCDDNGNLKDKYTSKTFSGVAGDCQIIKGPVPTGIVEVKL